MCPKPTQRGLQKLQQWKQSRHIHSLEVDNDNIESSEQFRLHRNSNQAKQFHLKSNSMIVGLHITESSEQFHRHHLSQVLNYLSK